MNSFDAAGPSERSSGLDHLIWMAFAAAMGSIIFSLLVVWSQGGFWGALGVVFLISSALATVFVGSAWAVFGPGSYLKRLLVSHLLCAFVGMGFLSGFAILVLSDLRNDDFLGPLLYVLLGIVPVSLAAQIPLWFFRFLFGWQFTFKGAPPAKSFSLRDIFAFTFLAALGFAATQKGSS